MVGFEGTIVTPQLAAWLCRFGWGGVMLFGRNIASPEHLLALSQALQQVAQEDGGLPLLIAIDQEGGRVTRLRPPFTVFPSAGQIGRLDAAQIAFEVGQASARELRAVGITMNMAPVLDVLTNPANAMIGDRALSSDAGQVARLGPAFIRGTHAAGVLATGKHFPGHGDTVLDSHIGRPVVRHAPARLEAVELAPFHAAIKAGVRALMSAHVMYPAWDPQYPATLSPTILRGVLREQMGFQGVVITDDLGMGAVADAFPWEEIPLLALRAGADLLLICHHRQRQEQAHARVLAALQNGELPESLVEQALARNQYVKSWLAPRHEEAIAAGGLACIGSAEHQALAATVAAGTAPAQRPARG